VVGSGRRFAVLVGGARVCWVQERERSGRGSVGRWPPVDRWAPVYWVRERETETETESWPRDGAGQRAPVVGRSVAGDGEIWEWGENFGTCSEPDSSPFNVDFWIFFFFLIKKGATWVKSRTPAGLLTHV
jgi:hypothetical protein